MSAHVAGLKSGHKLAQSIRRDILPHLPDKPVHKIDRRDIGAMLLAHQDRPATRALAFRQSRAMMRWMVNYGLAKRSPMDGMRTPPPPQPRTRHLNDHEIAALWLAIDLHGGDFKAFYRLCLLTGQRRGEVAGMARGEVVGDVWTIPAARTKNGHQHKVYLSPFAHKQLCHGNLYLTAPDRDRPLAGFSRAHARILDAMECAPWTIHDLRRTVKTGMARLGVSSDVQHRIFNHRSAIDPMDKIYNLYTYEKERREALLIWSEFVRDIVSR